MIDLKNKRKEIDKEIKSTIVPILKRKGFTGKYPHFRRKTENKIEILGFQFSQWGHQFYINIALAPKEGITLLDGRHFSPEIVKYNHCGFRARIGSNPFDYENEQFKEITIKINESLLEAETWWKNNNK